MYKIISDLDHREIGVVVEPRFIRKSTSGSYIQTDKENALGIAYRSVAYNLNGHEDFGAPETVSLFEIDIGDVTSDILSNNQELQSIEDVLCEQDTSLNRWMNAIEDALCELDKEDKL